LKFKHVFETGAGLKEGDCVISPAAGAAGNRSQKALRNASAFPSKAAAVFANQSSPLGSHKQRSIGGLEPESLLIADGSD
jgi:hypothetical protein